MSRLPTVACQRLPRADMFSSVVGLEQRLNSGFVWTRTADRSPSATGKKDSSLAGRQAPSWRSRFLVLSSYYHPARHLASMVLHGQLDRYFLGQLRA